MSVELRPLGVACNLACDYCYQSNERAAGNLRRRYDLDAMRAALEEHGQPFTLFGGEPLLLRLDELEEIWRWGHKRFGRNSVQTNGALITDAHIALFEAYEVEVGISIDGPGELNDARWNHGAERTRAATAKTEAAIERLCAAGRPPGIIATLHRLNATADRLPRMAEWFRRLDRLGVRAARLHMLEVDSPAVRERYALSERENVEALLFFSRLQSELGRLRFDVVDELRALLQGRDRNVSCVWRACDPYTTPAVQGVEGDGQSSNCGRTNKDGVDFSKADDRGFERYLLLHQLPQEHGGCRGCRFFLMCKGQCPGTAIDGDWRNRTEHCEIWKTMFEHVEAELVAEGVTPLTLRPERERIEDQVLRAWEENLNPPTAHFVDGIPVPARSG
jgi:uncharacterized protein